MRELTSGAGGPWHMLADGAWEDLGSTDLVTLRRQPSGDHPTGILVGSTVIRGFTLSEVLLTIRDDGCRRVWDHEMYDHTEFHGVLAPNAVLMRACLKGKVREPAPGGVGDGTAWASGSPVAVSGDGATMSVPVPGEPARH